MFSDIFLCYANIKATFYFMSCKHYESFTFKYSLNIAKRLTFKKTLHKRPTKTFHEKSSMNNM